MPEVTTPVTWEEFTPGNRWQTDGLRGQQGDNSGVEGPGPESTFTELLRRGPDPRLQPLHGSPHPPLQGSRHCLGPAVYTQLGHQKLYTDTFYYSVNRYLLNACRLSNIPYTDTKHTHQTHQHEAYAHPELLQSITELACPQSTTGPSPSSYTCLTH